MGLLDQFNFDDPQTMGLLSAAANMLQASGPSRTPTSFGQIAGGGLSAYTGAIEAARLRKQQEAQAAQVAQLRGLQIQEAQGGLQDHQRAREQADALRDFYTKRAPQNDFAAAQSVLTPGAAGGIGPTIANAAAIPQTAAQQQQQPGASGIYQQRLAEAQALRNAGFHQQADTTEAAALKFQPKVKNWQEVQSGGQVLYAPYYEDGTSGQPVPLEVARKLEFRDLGGRTAAIDPYTGRESASFARSQTPDSIASNAVAMRGQNLTDARAREAGMTPEYKQDADGNWLALPKKVGPGGTITALPVFGADGKPLAGAPKPLTESQGKASLFASRMDKANQIMTGLNNSGTKNTSAIKSALESVPLIGGALGTAGNFAASDPQQRLEQSQRDFVNAVLRQESGAAISSSEFESAQKQYFPQRGDSDATIAQKAANRATAIQGMALQSGPGAAKLGVGAQQQSAAGQKKSALKGQVMDGYRFKGGNPADQNSWEKL